MTDKLTISQDRNRSVEDSTDADVPRLSARLRIARDVIAREAAAVSAVATRLDHQFEDAVNLLLQANGRVIVTGMGKSGLIGQKIAATLSSTGTPSHFLHPVEAVHGDIGVVGSDDVVLVISKSASSDEISELLPIFKRLATPIILIAGNINGDLARRVDIVLDATVDSEAEPHDIVPTCSTMAALAIGDALAVTVLSERGFTPEQFAALHPKGALGKRLLLTVSDIMHTGDDIPLVNIDVLVKELLVEMTRKRLGVSGITDADGRLIGVFTDGDLRRVIGTHAELLTMTAGSVMTATPRTIAPAELAVTALARMEEHKITNLFIVDENNRPVGALHMHDIVSAGIV